MDQQPYGSVGFRLQPRSDHRKRCLNY